MQSASSLSFRNMQWRFLLALYVFITATLAADAQPKRTFTLEDDRFVRDGKPTQLISGRSVMHAAGSITALQPSP